MHYTTSILLLLRASISIPYTTFPSSIKLSKKTVSRKPQSPTGLARQSLEKKEKVLNIQDKIFLVHRLSLYSLGQPLHRPSHFVIAQLTFAQAFPLCNNPNTFANCVWVITKWFFSED